MMESTVDGLPLVIYQDAVPPIEFCNWRGMGGTEVTDPNSSFTADTAEVVMWYRPDVNERTQILLNDDPGLVYWVENAEDIELRHMWLILKVKRRLMALYDRVIVVDSVPDPWGKCAASPDDPVLPCTVSAGHTSTPDKIIFGPEALVKKGNTLIHLQTDGLQRMYVARDVIPQRDPYGRLTSKAAIISGD